MKRIAILAALAFATSTLTAHAGGIDPRLYGATAPVTAATRLVAVTPQTRIVQVNNGETVTFDIGGQRFTWTFQLYGQQGTLALAAILPRELHADGVTVYVAPDPLYR